MTLSIQGLNDLAGKKVNFNTQGTAAAYSGPLIFSRLGLVNTLLPLVIPSFFGSGFGVFLLHQYFRGIPGELVDAAQIDGANPGQILSRIFLPLSIPAFAALAIFIFLFSWNDLLHPMIYLGNPNTFTFPLGLSRFQNLNQQTNMWTIIMAGARGSFSRSA